MNTNYEYLQLILLELSSDFNNLNDSILIDIFKSIVFTG